MPFSEAQIKLLAGKLSEKHVRTRDHFGVHLSYIEGWHAIAEANRVFGFDGWDRETIWADCVWQDARREPKQCAYAARVRIRVRAGDLLVARDGSGVGQGSGDTLGEAHESALKEAETDATKRALTTFGNLFGLALYDKQQTGVRRYRGPNRNPIARQWRLLSSGGQNLGGYATAPEFCTALRSALETADTAQEIDSLWSRNRIVMDEMRVTLPELKTARGLHYSDVLRNYFEAQKLRFVVRDEKEGDEDGRGRIDKSLLPIGAPKRVRDPDHLAFLRALPCLICARTPSEPHHLRFTQPRGLSSKSSDEWTVPLCRIHHRALHDAGSEERWWEEQRLDPRIEAERLWRGRHQNDAAVTETLLTPPK